MKLTKKLLALLVALALVLSMAPATLAGDVNKTYVDVEEDDWFYDSVMAMTRAGYMEGINDTHFAPKTQVNRAMIVTVLFRAAGGKGLGAYQGTFSDVPQGKWYTEAVEWASENGIVNGYGDGTFKPTRTATREELAKIFYQFIQYVGQDNGGRQDLSSFTDARDVGSWAKESMQWAVHNFIIRGRAEGKLVPKGTCMRAELAEMMYRVVLSVTSDYYGKTVVLHTNDVHGSIEGYAAVAELRNRFEQIGADVILVDAGDFSQGTSYVSTTKGMDAVDMMNAAGYNLATLGNHEFDYGYQVLQENMGMADFEVLCANVLDEWGEPIFEPGTVVVSDFGLSVGFVGVITPETRTKANPALIQGLQFLEGKEMYEAVQDAIDTLKRAASTVIAISHLGVDKESEPNRSYDLFARTLGLNFIIDGHSHSVMTEGERGAPIQSTGTGLEYAGYVVLDSHTGEVVANGLEPLKYTDDAGNSHWYAGDADVAAAAQDIVDRVLEEYGKVFARSDVELDGVKASVRSRETNLGDLIADAILWAATKEEGSIKVPQENVIAVTNGGGIRASIPVGDITKNDVHTVLPFGNTVSVVYVTGTELLEALEASTFCTPNAIGGFPQVAGMKYTVDTTKAFDPTVATYPGSTYYGPASINRVTIDEINGQSFDVNAIYAVVTNDFLASGGDSYYAFVRATEQFDTGLAMDEALIAYITEVLSGVVGTQYAAPQGRITLITESN